MREWCLHVAEGLVDAAVDAEAVTVARGLGCWG